MDKIFIKIGGSAITDINKENTPKKNEIKRLLNEIKHSINKKKILIGHGSGSFAHVPAHKYKINLGLVEKNSLYGTSITQNAAANLHRIFIECAVEEQLFPFSFSPSTGAIAESSKIITWDVSVIQKAFDLGFIPVTYGDVILDKKQGVCIASTEEIFRFLSCKIKPNKIIIGTDVDGIFDSNPKLNKDAKLIEVVNSKNIEEVLGYSGSSTKIDVTGGMKSKVSYLYNISKETGAICQIINLQKEDRLKNVLLGENVLGTIINANK
ncbi:MAG: isopentenyl phosphate kinase [Candidatus Micrarchaeaceae archaeon]